MQSTLGFTLRILRNTFQKSGILPQLVRSMSSAGEYQYETLTVTSPREHVFQVELNRPDNLNAMNQAFWREIRECFQKIADDGNCRAVILTAAGRVFTAGLDLTDFASIFAEQADLDVGRKAFKTRETLKALQDSFTSIEKCNKPVIAAIHSACIGGGVDMTSACDIRYCTQDTFFQIKEVDLGLAADVGTLQRFPKVIGNDSLCRELCYTARKMFSAEAQQLGYISRIFPSRDEMISGALETASLIASKSPVAVQVTKANLVYSRDHTVDESLDHIAVWNQGMLQSEDVMKAAMAYMQKQKPNFSKL